MLLEVALGCNLAGHVPRAYGHHAASGWPFCPSILHPASPIRCCSGGRGVVAYRLEGGARARGIDGHSCLRHAEKILPLFLSAEEIIASRASQRHDFSSSIARLLDHYGTSNSVAGGAGSQEGMFQCVPKSIQKVTILIDSRSSASMKKPSPTFPLQISQAIGPASRMNGHWKSSRGYVLFVRCCRYATISSREFLIHAINDRIFKSNSTTMSDTKHPSP